MEDSIAKGYKPMIENGKPVFFLEYENKDITKYIGSSVLSVSYTDNLVGKADEIDINIENSSGKWLKEWYPSKGDNIRLRIGYEGHKLINSGVFQIDELEFVGPPDVLTIKGISTPIKKALKQKNTAGYENKLLVDIAKEIGKKHGFTVVGSSGFVKVARVTQKKESDLAFLYRIAEMYGYVFKITDSKLVFYATDDLQSKNTVRTIKKTDIEQYSFVDLSKDTYSKVEINYYSAKQKKLITHHTQAESGGVKGDTLKINKRFENKQQAELAAKAALKKHHDFQKEGSITFLGDPNLVAGQNIALSGFGVFDLKYQINSARHTISKSAGYKTELELKSV